MVARTVPWSADLDTWKACERATFRTWEPHADLAVDLTALPLLHIAVTTPRDQAVLHRHLANLGYVPELMFADEVTDYWRFQHPDGVKP